MYYQKHHPWSIWIMVAFMIFDVVLHVIIYVITHGGGKGWLLLSFLPSMSILSFFTYLFRLADHGQLRFGYALWSVRLNLTDIAQIEETNIKWLKWGGQGWRLKSLKHIGYITGDGPGIHLVLSTDREYTFNCDDPVACITAFQTKTADGERQALAVGEQTIVA